MSNERSAAQEKLPGLDGQPAPPRDPSANGKATLRPEPARPAAMPAHESSADSNGHQGPERPLGDHLAHVVTLYRKWFFLADPGHLLVVLGCIVANLLPGDPVWLMLVAVASAGKTEMLQACKGLPHVFSAATLTEGSLLSRTAQKERTPGAPGGLLRAVGEFGIVLLMDFGSLPSMNRDTGPIQFAVMQS